MDKPDTTGSAGDQGMDDIGQLIRVAGGRDAVPPERFAQARLNVMSHWQQLVRDQRRPRIAATYRFAAIAASLVVAVAASTVWLRGGDAPLTATIATVERATGPAYADNAKLNPGDSLSPDARIETSEESRVALRLAGGQSLRIDTSSEVILHASNRLSLQGGGLYIDTEGLANASPVIVMTSLGQAQDVGTQFQVRDVDDLVTIGVREGLVEFTRPNNEKTAVNSGRFLDLSSTGSDRERLVGETDPAWNWVETVAPSFDIDGASLREYLSWYARQRGLRLAWSDSQSEARAGAIRLSGTIAGTSLEEGLGIVHRIARFEHRIDGDTLRISVQ
jgi:ferric-dicitrate binding protein FerR (iron transport regulator)